MIKAYLNEDLNETESNRPYCVEIYREEEGEIVGEYEYEYYQTKKEAEKRISYINNKKINKWEELDDKYYVY